MSTLVPKIKLRNARAWAPRTPWGWIAALAAFLVALLIRLALHDYLGPRYPLLFFGLATIVVHFFFGLGPAVLLALVSLPTGLYVFVPPYLSFEIPHGDSLCPISSSPGALTLILAVATD